jgi:peptide chain release factor 2
VRITHKPTGIIAQSQKERSQHSNKDTAMKLLKSRLLQQKLEAVENKKKQENKEKQAIGFGNQTRSYILHPYKLVKDHHTGYEDSQVESVLMGDINGLLEYIPSINKQ